MKKREHVLEICDQTVQCVVCLHVDWMEDTIPEECPGPPKLTRVERSKAAVERLNDFSYLKERREKK